MYYYIYKITNIHNNKFYIGSHKTPDLNDGYFGSGIYLNRSIKKYGKDNFKKEYLMFCSSEEEVRIEVTKILQTIKNNDTYNLKFCAMGGNTREKYNDQEKANYIQKLIDNPKSPIGKKGTNAFNYGISPTNETKDKQKRSRNKWFTKLKTDPKKYSLFKDSIVKTSLENIKKATDANKKPVVIYDKLNNKNLYFNSKKECITILDIPMSILKKCIHNNTGTILLCDILSKKKQLQERNQKRKQPKQQTVYRLLYLKNNSIQEFATKKSIIAHLNINYDQINILCSRKIRRSSYDQYFLSIFDSYILQRI